VWIATRKPKNKYGQSNSTNRPHNVVYVPWKNKIITFDDMSRPKSPLRSIIETSSVTSEEVTSWFADKDKSRIILQLLNKIFALFTKSIDLRQEKKLTKFRKVKWKPKFYYPCFGENRTETWSPRFKKSSTVTVAQRLWANQLKRPVFWHVAVKARFTFLGGKLFLRLIPTLLITENGFDVVQEGTIVTRLVYNRYNASYFNSLLFWVSRFAEEKENITIAEGEITISSKPVESKINVGIIFDRPAAELLQETPEINISEEK
jgi:hypothetical protein